MPAVVQSQSYIPDTDWGFKSFLQNFSTLISLDPVKYGLVAADATIIAGHYTAFSAAFDTIQAPTTRNVSTIAAKDATRAAAIVSIRVYAQNIKQNQGVDNADKSALGIHLDDPTQTPVPVPVSAPILAIVAAFSGQHQIRYADENSPTSAAKPQGAVNMQLNRTVEAGANPDPTVSTMVGMFTKNPLIVTTDPVDAGFTATYFARWMNRKGEFGPWSLPVSMTIAFGGPVVQQIPAGGTAIEGDDQLKIAA